MGIVKSEFAHDEYPSWAFRYGFKRNSTLLVYGRF